MKSVYRLFSVALVIFAVMVSGASAQEEERPPLPVFIDDVEADGDVMILMGQVLDRNGDPLENVAVEIWQTDTNGGYDHPSAPQGNLDPNFQHFGTSVSDEAGWYIFRTVYPSKEGIGRPLHIHVKVRIEGEQVLIAQFYFVEDSANSQPEISLLDPEEVVTEDGKTILLATKDIVLDTTESAGGGLPITPPTFEGPYYPVVDMSDMDNDLAVVSEQTVTMRQVFGEFTLLNLNTASDEDFLTIPDMTDRMVREFNEYQPYISILQFRREIGKYVDEAVVAGYELYLYVPVVVNESDAATLMQIPGVDEVVAQILIDARPYADEDAFLVFLGELAPEVDLDYAAHFLEVE